MRYCTNCGTNLGPVCLVWETPAHEDALAKPELLYKYPDAARDVWGRCRECYDADAGRDPRHGPMLYADSRDTWDSPVAWLIWIAIMRDPILESQVVDVLPDNLMSFRVWRGTISAEHLAERLVRISLEQKYHLAALAFGDPVHKALGDLGLGLMDYALKSLGDLGWEGIVSQVRWRLKFGWYDRRAVW